MATVRIIIINDITANDERRSCSLKEDRSIRLEGIGRQGRRQLSLRGVDSDTC